MFKNRCAVLGIQQSLLSEHLIPNPWGDENSRHARGGRESDMHSTTDRIWEAARHMVNSFISRLPALILAVAVFIAFYALSHLAARAIRRMVSKHRQNLALVFARLAGGGTILFGLLVAISIVAPSFQASDLIKILGIGGVAIGFAFQNILQNFLAGLLLLGAEPFRVGDEIKLDAFEGKREEMTAWAT